VPVARNFQDLDAYAAAWRSVLVGGLREYKAAAAYCFSAILVRRRDEARFLRMNGGVAAETHNKAHAHRAWRRNADAWRSIGQRRIETAKNLD
jgi:hypothetical protein